MKTKTIILLTLISGLIYMAGCSKSSNSPSTSASIVGVWTQTTSHETDQTNGIITRDTTSHIPAGYVTIRFTADGHYYDYAQGALTDSGIYTYRGSVLSSYDHGDTTAAPVTEPVPTLNDHTLVLIYSSTPAIHVNAQTTNTYTR